MINIVKLFVFDNIVREVSLFLRDELHCKNIYFVAHILIQDEELQLARQEAVLLVFI
jgi:hypothetical protein